MITRNIAVTFCLLSFCFSSIAQAHFLTLFPKQQIIDQGDNKNLEFAIFFTHPMDQGPTMSIDKPEAVGVIVNGKKTLLDDSLKAVFKDQLQGWKLDYRLRRPGTYNFFANQTPYLDKSEDKFLTQYAKVIVDAFAANQDWQVSTQAPVEIMPLTRPFALWTNSVFVGQVLVNGKPAADIPVELEYHNPSGLKSPSDIWLNQQVNTNSLGEFSIALPRAGWWGMAALVEEEQPIVVDGQSYPHESAGVLWLQTRDFPTHH